MSFTFEELKGKTVADLRLLAKETEHDAVQGYTQMNKETLLGALCDALGIAKKVHKKKTASHKSLPTDKAGIKAEIKALKEKRGLAISTKDKETLKRVRRRLHKMKRASRIAVA